MTERIVQLRRNGAPIVVVPTSVETAGATYSGASVGDIGIYIRTSLTSEERSRRDADVTAATAATAAPDSTPDDAVVSQQAARRIAWLASLSEED